MMSDMDQSRNEIIYASKTHKIVQEREHNVVDSFQRSAISVANDMDQETEANKQENG